MRADLSELQLFGTSNGIRVEVVDEGEAFKHNHVVETSDKVREMGWSRSRGEKLTKERGFARMYYGTKPPREGQSAQDTLNEIMYQECFARECLAD